MLGLSRGLPPFLLVVLGALGCSSGDEFTVDVSGNYSVALTDGDNSCKWAWGNRDANARVPFTITQDGKDLTGKIMGLDAIGFALIFGTDDFKGTANGKSFTLTKPGNALKEGNCPYSYNATIEGSVEGDSISGTITYATATNGNPACADVECSATQLFAGSRPPK